MNKWIQIGLVVGAGILLWQAAMSAKEDKVAPVPEDTKSESPVTPPVTSGDKPAADKVFVPDPGTIPREALDPRMPAPVTATAPADGSWSDPPTDMPGGVYYPQYQRNGAMELQYRLRNGTRGVIPILENNEGFVFIPTNTVSFRVRNPEGKTLAQLSYEDAEKQKLLHPSTAPAEDPWPLPQRSLTLVFTDIPPVWPEKK